MSATFHVFPQAGRDAPTERIARALAEMLAETGRLAARTRSAVKGGEGPLFMTLHEMASAFADNMETAAGALDARLRALGAGAAAAAPEAGAGVVRGDAGARIAALAADHAAIAGWFRALEDLAAAGSDEPTEALATARAVFHERAAALLLALGADWRSAVSPEPV